MSQIVTNGARTSGLPLIEWLQSDEGRAKQPKAPSPTHGITVSQIIADYHVGHPRIDKAIREGDLCAQVVFEQRGRTQGPIKFIRASRDDAKRLFGNTDAQAAPVAPDLESVKKLAREFRVSRNTIVGWCAWLEHPALCDAANPHGRRIRSEKRTRTVETANGHTRQYADSLMASRSDVKKCVYMLNQNPIGERFGDNPGVWGSVESPRGKRGSKNKDKKKKHYPGIKGSLQHADGRIFFTQATMMEKYGLPRSAFSKEIYLSKLDCIRVILPGVRGKDGSKEWRIPVYSQDSGKNLQTTRKGKTKDGDWLVPNRVWNEQAGEFKGIIYTAQHIIEILKQDGARLEPYQLNNWCQQGKLTKYKSLPRAVENGRKHGPNLRGFHSCEIDPLFLQAKKGEPLAPAPVDLPGDEAGPRQSGRRLLAEKVPLYRKCHELYARVKINDATHITLRTAVALIIKEFDPDVLGKDAVLDDQTNRLKKNAAVYENHLEREKAEKIK